MRLLLLVCTVSKFSISCILGYYIIICLCNLQPLKYLYMGLIESRSLGRIGSFFFSFDYFYDYKYDNCLYTDGS